MSPVRNLVCAALLATATLLSACATQGAATAPATTSVEAAGWVWMPTATLVNGMRTFDTVENRGYVRVQAP